jgi:glycosyltransferase involved in cell wall biosynthesis
LGFDDSQPVVGLIARYNPIKDHPNFLEAARILAAQFPDLRFVLAGRDITPANAALSSLIAACGLQDRVLLLGARDDAPRLMQALDVLALSSAFGEGFPNVIGEAMACGVPVVATDIGDSQMIIGDTGVVVPLRDPQALADGLARVLRLSAQERRDWGLRARARIAAEFSIEQIASRYEAMYQSLADKAKAQPSGRGPGQR